MVFNQTKPLLSKGIFLLALLLLTEIAVAERSYRVRSADNLNRIVEILYPDRELKKSQIMVGILARNPRAFKGGNINYLLRRKRIILPNESDMSGVSVEEAKAILKQHADFFRLGITGTDELNRTKLNKKSGNSRVNNDLSEQAKLQKQKILNLEKESNALKTRLEKLFEQKKERDQKIVDLEVKIQKSLKHQSLEKGNTVSSSSLTKDDVQNLIEENNKKQADLNDSSDALIQTPSSALKQETEVVLSENIKENTTVIDKVKNVASWSKIFWVLPLLLFGFMWWLFQRKRKTKESNEDLASLIANSNQDFGHNVSEQNQSYQDENILENSVKLDVARAYVEAGDNDSAVGILKQVVNMGNTEESESARKILRSIQKI